MTVKVLYRGEDAKSEEYRSVVSAIPYGDGDTWFTLDMEDGSRVFIPNEDISKVTVTL